MFASYGQVMDLKLLQDKGFSLEGKILLVKTGKISFAEKVCRRYQSMFNPCASIDGSSMCLHRWVMLKQCEASLPWRRQTVSGEAWKKQ